MFQATRRRLALWYTAVTAVLLLLFASGFYLYVRQTLVERIDDTLNHVVEIVQRSLVIESVIPEPGTPSAQRHINLEASFPGNAAAVEDDHIDLEWFSPTGELLWSTFSLPLDLPLHVNSDGETVYAGTKDRGATTEGASLDLYPVPFALRQITHRIEIGDDVVGYLRVSHPWFEVTKPSRQLIRDLSLGIALMIGTVAAIGWLLSGLAIAPVRDSYQRLKQFTADASHELRNPIAVIQTNVQVALADPDPHLQQDQLRVVERLTRRLGRLVDNLLFLARHDSGITPLQLEPVDLQNLLQEVLEEQQAIATDKQLRLLLRVESAKDAALLPYFTIGDRDQLTRLFTNLISNAVQYTPADGQVEVILQRLRQAGGVQVQVRDTGIGIPSEFLPHVFDRFYRVDPARSARVQGERPDGSTGSGLGLAIAKVIVETHQGQILIDSLINQGTTVTVTFPAHRSDLNKPPLPAADRPNGTVEG